MELPIVDARVEAARLMNDPDHLRRKAAYIREQAALGGPLEVQRWARARELDSQADELEVGHA